MTFGGDALDGTNDCIANLSLRGREPPGRGIQGRPAVDSREGHAGMTFGGDALDGTNDCIANLSLRGREPPGRGIQGRPAMDSR